MSFAYYIILDNDDPGFDVFVNGKALAHSFEEIDAVCTQERLGKLDQFIGQSAEDFGDLLSEEMELPEGESGEAIWFDPDEGIAFFDALTAKIRANPAMRLRGDLLEELDEYRRILVQAKAIGAKWCLAVDI
jgi:hypothetical protein